MSIQSLSYIDIASLLGIESEALEEMFWQKACELQVAVPCVVVSFNGPKQTVVVQVAIQENLKLNGVPTPINIPPLEDVPIMLPRAGGFTLTLPVQAGDECLVVFSNMCIDAWWQSGGTDNGQIKRRRHSLSDGVALLGCWSQPRVVPSYSTLSAQLRTDDGVTVIDIIPGRIIVKGTNIKLQGDVQVTGDLIANTIHGRAFLTHEHTGVTTGGGVTGGVV